MHSGYVWYGVFAVVCILCCMQDSYTLTQPPGTLSVSCFSLFCHLCCTQVEMPGEPKLKKFEDWQKKASVFYNSFKGAKV